MSKVKELLNIIKPLSLINEDVQYVTFTIPLLIRLFEFAREESPDDETLHFVAERSSSQNKNFDMQDYYYLVGKDPDDDGDDDSSPSTDTDLDNDSD